MVDVTDTGTQTVGNIIPLSRARRQGLSDRTDDELMELAAAGLREALTELVRRYHVRVRSYCRKWDPALGDDLAQEVFLKLWKARATYRPEGQFALYLFTVVRNTCRNAARHRFRSPPLEPLSPSAISAEHPDQLDELLQAERNRRVNREIAKLSPKIREAVLLRFAETMTYSEISQVVEATEATVRSRVHLGIARLKDVCGENI